MTAAARPQVGDTLTTAEQLDALPVGSIFLSPSDAVWRRMDESESEGGYRFESLEYDGRFQAATFARFGEFPLRVLYVPGEQPCRHCGSCDGPPSCPDCDHADRPSVTDNARAEEQSGYTVQQTAAHFARRVQRVSDRIRSTDYQRSVSDLVALDNVEGFLDRIARDDLDVFAAGRAETTTDDATQRLARAAFAVDSTHHFHVNSAGRPICTCGFVGDARARTQTEHITAAVLEEYDHD